MPTDYPPPMPLSEELELARRYHAGDRDAGTKIVASHLRFLVAEARRQAHRWGHEEDDLVQEGVPALLRALRHFNPDHGHRLITFASHTIRMFMARYGQAARTAVGSPNTANRQQQYRLAHRTLSRRLGHDPEPDEVHAEIGWSRRVADAVDRLRRGDVSLSRTAIQKDGRAASAFGETLACPAAQPDEQIDAERSASLLRQVVAFEVAQLDPREQWVIYRRHLASDPATLREVAAELPGTGGKEGISRERTRQIEEEALAKLRKALECNPAIPDEWVEQLGEPVAPRGKGMPKGPAKRGEGHGDH